METINPSTTLRACLDALTRPFDPAQIKQREGRKGKMLDYLECHTIITRLNEAFNGAWSFEVVDYKSMEGEVIVHGKLSAGGQVKQQFGSNAIDRFATGENAGKPVSIGDDLKAAASDALKKCATLFGIGLELYEKKGQAQRPAQQRPTPQADQGSGSRPHGSDRLGGKPAPAQTGQQRPGTVTGRPVNGTTNGRSYTPPGR